jgi:quercetin dioxygenase-like cupin family protein
MANMKNYRDHTGSRQDKHFKDTLFQGEYLMVGINCLEAGQEQPVHQHEAADKVYIVMEGIGRFTVGNETRDATEGDVIWAPAGSPHGVKNPVRDRLVLLVGIAPPPGSK